MARKSNHQFEKRKREQIRTERATERRTRKLERTAASPTSRSGASEDPDLAGIVVGPQPRDEISEQEARRAVERAMNPGTAMGGDEARGSRTSRIFVGNLDFTAREDELRELFVAAGFTVEEASIVRDRSTGQPRGFAFVEVQGFKEAARAVTKLNGTELAGRPLRLSVAESK